MDDHHYDLQHGKISPETVQLCRRCHSTIHMFRGIHMFEDIYLDRAIEVFNKTQLLLGKKTITRDQIERSKYWLKKHGIKGVKGINEENGSQTPPFKFNLPKGEPLCGWEWVNEHLYDLMDYVPSIEIIGPGINLVSNINSIKDLKEVSKTLRGLKGNRRNGNSKKTITYNPVMKRFSQ